MINYIRTLLLNRSRDGASPDEPGEEYIPSSFRERALTTDLQLAHTILLGSDSDRLFRNYRLRQLLTLLHNSEYGYLATAADPRVTYWPFDAQFYDEVFGVTQEPVGHTASLPFLAGNAICDEGRGRCIFQWRLQALSDNRVRISQQRPDATVTVVEYTTMGTLSSPIALPNSNLTFRVRAGEDAREWLITAKTRPSTDIAVVMSRLFLAVPPERLLAYTRSPVITGYWQNAQNDQQRFALVLLGIASGVAACEVQP